MGIHSSPKTLANPTTVYEYDDRNMKVRETFRDEPASARYPRKRRKSR